MKMNKIVLASLLSVSLLGASTSVFAAPATQYAEVTENTADNTSSANTSTKFVVEGGSLKLSDVTGSMDFGSVKVADLLGADKDVPANFGATVTDTLGDATKGWTLTADYTQLTGKSATNEGAELAENLTIGKAVLSKTNNSAVVYNATPDAVAATFKNAKGVSTLSNSAELHVPAGAAAAGAYEGNIKWTLAAVPGNTTTANTSNDVPATTVSGN